MSASTIAYQLRPLKAIERNLFISILKKLDRFSAIDLSKYAYVGFGAPFFEDFKLMHLEFGIVDMDCIEYDDFAYSRQIFNNPYYFVKLYNTSFTNYITSDNFRQDRNQIIWLDFASPKEFRQQLIDIELTSQKCERLDILKFTFNAHLKSFVHHINCKPFDYKNILKVLKNDPTYQLYLPESITTKDISDDFSSVIRAMGIRAIKRGLSKANKGITFNHISSFDYADGQAMTTSTGIISNATEFDEILKQSGLRPWEFYQPMPTSELIGGNEIAVPVMTVPERMKIDKLIPLTDTINLAEVIEFSFGDSKEEHSKLVEGYCRYYKYLPYYSKVTF